MHERDFMSPDMIDLMSAAQLKTMLDGIVSQLPTQSPIFLPTDKIPLKEQLKGLTRVGDIYRTGLDSTYRPRLRSLREGYKDRGRCFVIGNGPSLNRTDLVVLKDEVTFAVNGFFLKARELDWRPTFYVVEDHLVAEDRRDAIEAFKGPTKLFPAYLGYCFEPSDDTIFFNHRPRKSYPHGFDFSTDAEQVTYTGCTVTFTCLQLAYYLGFTQIYLIGVDSDYAIPADAEQQKDYGVGVIDMKSDDPNHFHPDYFGKGFRWHDPQVDKMLEAYAEARRIVDSNGRSILNATVGGKLEVFDRVAFTSLFSNARSPEEMDRIHAASFSLATESAGLAQDKREANGNVPVPTTRAELGNARPGTADFPGVPLRESDAGQNSGSKNQTEIVDLPRVLIFDITRSGDGTATGEVKATLFANWPPDRLVQFYSLGGDRIGVDGAVPKVLRRHKSLSAEDISRVVRWFGPEVVLYRPVPDNLALHAAAMSVIRSSDLPLAIWIMDDWPRQLADDDPELFTRLESDLRELLARAELRLSICDRMSAAFAERYKVSFKAFSNAVDPADWPDRRRQEAHASTFVLRYAGALATSMGVESVLRTARAVERLASDGVDIAFEINTRPYWQKISGLEFKHLQNTSIRTECLTPGDYRQWLSEADALLIAYNFDEASKNYVRYSLANKLPECLASGAVLVAHGPSDVATIEYVRSLDCAVVVDDDDEERLASELRKLVNNSSHRHELSEKARAVAFNAHNVHRMRRALQAEFLAITAHKTTANGRNGLSESGRMAQVSVGPQKWLWQVAQSHSLWVLGVLSAVALLITAPTYEMLWDYRVLFWGSAGVMSLLAVVLLSVSVGEKAVRRMLELQNLELASRLGEMRRGVDRHMAVLEAWLAVLDKNAPIRGTSDAGVDRRKDGRGQKSGVKTKGAEVISNDASVSETRTRSKSSILTEMEQGHRSFETPAKDPIWQSVKQIREASKAVLPHDAAVLVVSKGDDRLLDLGGRKAWHFPRTEDGQYTGYHPGDSAAAIAHLEALRDQGANFLLVPDTAFWWFDHYCEFKQHLDSHYQRVATPEFCTIYRLSAVGAERQSRDASMGLTGSLSTTAFRPMEKLLIRYREIRESMAGSILHLMDGNPALAPPDYARLIRSIRDFVTITLPEGATLVVVSKGDEELLRMGNRQASHFPRAEDGSYAGYYPVNDRIAIEHLDSLKTRGAEFLLLPRTAFWWLEHYQEFRDHLFANYRVRVARDKSAMIFNLAGGASEPAEQLAARQAIDAAQGLPGESELRLEIGRLLGGLGRQAEAVAILTDGVRQDPTNPRFYSELIRIARRRGDFESAERYASEVASREGIDYVLGLELVQLDLQRGRFDAAQDRLSQLIAMFPSEPATYDLTKCICNPVEAPKITDQRTMVQFLERFATSPAGAKSPEIQLQIAEILQQLDAHPQALSALRAVLRTLDFGSEVLKEYADGLLRQAGLVTSDQIACGDGQAWATTLTFAGNAFLATRDVFRAEACYRMALTAQAGKPAPRINLAFLNLDCGDVVAAVEQFSELPQTYAEEASQIVWPVRGGTPWPFKAFDLAGVFDQLNDGSAAWPKISVVIQCIDQDSHIEPTLLSVLKQDYPELECIVVDGSSSEETRQLFARYRDRLSILSVEPETSPTDALCRGLNRAAGEILVWLDPDDLLAPGALFMVALSYLDEDADIIAGFCLEHDAGRIEAVHVPAASQATFNANSLGDIFNYWLKDHYFSTTQVAFSRRVFERAGACLDASVQFTAAYELWLRCAAAGAKLTRLHWPVGFRRHDKNKSNKSDQYIIECANVRDRYVTVRGSLEKRLRIDCKVRQALSRNPTTVAVVTPRGCPTFSADLQRELTHTLAPDGLHITLVRSVDELPLDVDIVILIVPFAQDGFDSIRNMSKTGFRGPIVGWLWDNHLSVSEHRQAMWHLDVCIPGHGFAASYLRSPEHVLAESLPPCSTQWSQTEARLFFDRHGLVNRKDSLYAGFASLPYAAKLNQFIQQLIDGGVDGVCFLDTGRLDADGDRDPDQRFAEWTSHKASLCLSVDGELSQRLFDALLTGQVPIISADIRDFELLIPEAIQRELSIVKLNAYTPEAVREAHALAIKLFDRDGYSGIERRHRFVVDGHTFISRMRALFDGLDDRPWMTGR